MNTGSGKPPRDRSSATDGPYFIFHPSFEEPDAERVYGGIPAEDAEPLAFMPDDTTRSWTKRMHYAAWRVSTSGNKREAARWRRRYYDRRDRIVLGNRKLTFRAVQKWKPASYLADDLAGECQIVLIKAVAAFNPWLGVRFSTYTFTCLMRALSRLSQRRAADRLSRWLPLGSLPCGEPRSTISEGPARTCIARLEEYLRAEHTLLTPREKTVLMWRYRLEGDVPETGTLEQIGRRLGLSKERVRQMQSTALGKLRTALLAEPPGSCARR
jgi:RNA polymerase sigma factor (sigma-70 family)